MTTVYIYILYTVYTTIISSRKKTVIFNNPNDSLLLSLLTWTQNECEHKTIPFQTWSEVTHVHLFEELLWERIGLTVVGVNHRFAWEKLLPKTYLSQILWGIPFGPNYKYINRIFNTKKKIWVCPPLGLFLICWVFLNPKKIHGFATRLRAQCVQISQGFRE